MILGHCNLNNSSTSNPSTYVYLPKGERKLVDAIIDRELCTCCYTLHASACGHIPDMRPSPRWLNALERLSYRHKSISFIGLGRMGHEMAYNLFSKQYTPENKTHFVVCDAIPDTARAFCEKILSNFPGIKISIVFTPKEYVSHIHTLLHIQIQEQTGQHWPPRL